MNSNKDAGVAWWLTTTLVLMFVLSLAYFGYANYRAGSGPVDLAISSLILSVPLVLLYGSIGVLVTANRQRHIQGQVSARLTRWIYWTPRIAGVLIILFVSAFALDVFDGGGSFWEMLGGFVIHALPAILMAVVLAFAWHRDWIGFVAFLAASIFFLRFLIRNPLENLGHLLLFSGPMAVIAFAFWANWKWKKEIPPAQKPG